MLKLYHPRVYFLSCLRAQLVRYLPLDLVVHLCSQLIQHCLPSRGSPLVTVANYQDTYSLPCPASTWLSSPQTTESPTVSTYLTFTSLSSSQISTSASLPISSISYPNTITSPKNTTASPTNYSTATRFAPLLSASCPAFPSGLFVSRIDGLACEPTTIDWPVIVPVTDYEAMPTLPRT